MPKFDMDTDAWDEDEAVLTRRTAKKRATPAPAARNAKAPKVAAEAPVSRLTYKPSEYEGEWLEASLRTFFEQDFITDIEVQVKGGKEATVYRCTAHPSTGREWIAAKVYRPRRFRALNDDTAYRVGRPLLNAQGGELKKSDRRMARAIDRRTGTARQIEQTSWLMYEFTTLQQMWDGGAGVPEPLAAAENALLMEYLGDDEAPAPTLSQVRLTKEEAQRAFDDVVAAIDRLLSLGFTHGDLSAYNILYWEDGVRLIDFPQVVSLKGNPNARTMFGRDVERVCGYFQRQGVRCDAEALGTQLWEQYMRRTQDEQLADESRVVDL